MPGVVAGAAGDDRHALDGRYVEVDLRQRDLLFDGRRYERSVCATTVGCSKISFCMKWR
jgi:hypothetical protein